MSNAGGMEELLPLTCPIPGAGLQGPPHQLQTVVCSSPYGPYKNPLDTDRISPNMGQKFGLRNHLLGKKKRPRAVWRGSGVFFFI